MSDRPAHASHCSRLFLSSASSIVAVTPARRIPLGPGGGHAVEGPNPSGLRSNQGRPPRDLPDLGLSGPISIIHDLVRQAAVLSLNDIMRVPRPHQSEMRFPTRRLARLTLRPGDGAIRLGEHGVHARAELHVLKPGGLGFSATGKLRVGPFADALKIDSAHGSMIERRG
jgi:hypothetical protein